MYQPTVDLAGQVCFRPNFFQTKGRINHLIDRYLNDTVLCDRLDDLPQQFIESNMPKRGSQGGEATSPHDPLQVRRFLRSVLHRGELIYTFMWILKQMWHWSGERPEFFGNNSGACDRPEVIIV